MKRSYSISIIIILFALSWCTNGQSNYKKNKALVYDLVRTRGLFPDKPLMACQGTGHGFISIVQAPNHRLKLKIITSK